MENFKESINDVDPTVEYLPKQEKLGFHEGVERLSDGIIEQTKTKDSVVCSLGAESASGKGYFFDQVKARLEHAEIGPDEILSISTDDYYKGISRMVIERICKTLGTSLDTISEEDINNFRSIIGNRFFDFKFGNGYREDGIEIDDKSLMSEVYSRLTDESNNEPTTKEDASRLEWAFKYVLKIDESELDNINFHNLTPQDRYLLSQILVKHNISQQSFLNYFSGLGVMEQIRDYLMLGISTKELEELKESNPAVATDYHGLRSELIENGYWDKIKGDFTTDGLNFDTPDAVDLDNLRRDLEAIKAGHPIKNKLYNMRTSEPITMGTDFDKSEHSFGEFNQEGLSETVPEHKQPKVVLVEGFSH